MHKDVAAAKRGQPTYFSSGRGQADYQERHFQPFKPEVNRLPVSSWAKNAQNALRK